MRKIVSLFQRNHEGNGLVRDEVVPGAEWVANGEGIATRKWDGTCCLIRGGKLYKRFDAKHGKTPPAGFEPAQEPDPVTGHHPGWIAVGDGPEDRWHREAGVMLNWPYDAVAWKTVAPADAPDGTYELLGPKIQGSPDGFAVHVLLPHGRHFLEGAPRDFDGLRDYFAKCNIEGIVWHHPDGRMVKIKTKDFGLKRKR